MGFGLSKQRVSPIAVDFGADSLKLLQVVPEQPAQLLAAAAAVVPEEARQDSAARMAFYSQTLRKLLKQQPFKGRRAMLAIPSQSTLMQNLDVTAQEGADTGPLVEAHLRDRLGMDPARLVVRHFDAGQIADNGSSFQEVVVIAVQRETVISYLNLARQCKLDVVGMHSVPQAILQGFAQLYQRSDDAERVVGFLDIGSAVTTLVIARGQRMVFAKTFAAAGDQMTRQYAQMNKVSFTAAREARMNGKASAGSSGGGAVAVMESASSAATSAPGAAAQEQADPTLDFLMDELQMCVRYYQRRFPQQPLSRLVFLGGESRHTDLCQKIARKLRIAAQLGDPFAALMRISKAKNPVGVDLNQPQPGWTVPYGLCWSEANL